MDVVAHAGIAQQRVRATIGQLGGYWRPLAAVARLLEELGELASEQLPASAATAAAALELADLWIITTALADQFLVGVSEPGAMASSAAHMGAPDLEPLVAAAGQIARVVNYYDGPNVPRDLQQLPTLKSAVVDFHHELATCARAWSIDLEAVVHQKLDTIAARDSGRFARSYDDPSMQPCIEQFRSIGAEIPGLNLVTVRLWGACVCSPETAGSLSNLASSLRTFSRAAAREQLEGYVIAGPETLAAGDLGNWLPQLLDRLSAYDSRREGNPERTDAVQPGAFSFEGLAMTVESFLPPHPAGDPSHAVAHPFGLLRPSP